MWGTPGPSVCSNHIYKYMKNLDLFETSIHSFVIKIWLEETADENASNLWRGHISHIPSGEKRYIQNLNEMMFFVFPYIEEIGIKIPLKWRIAKLVKGKRFRKRLNRDQ